MGATFGWAMCNVTEVGSYVGLNNGQKNKYIAMEEKNEEKAGKENKSKHTNINKLTVTNLIITKTKLLSPSKPKDNTGTHQNVNQGTTTENTHVTCGSNGCANYATSHLFILPIFNS